MHLYNERAKASTKHFLQQPWHTLKNLHNFINNDFYISLYIDHNRKQYHPHYFHSILYKHPDNSFQNFHHLPRLPCLLT